MAFLKLPEKLRSELKKPAGTLMKDIRDIKINPGEILVTVGDKVTEEALLHNMKPKVCIYDGKINRIPVPISEKIMAYEAEQIGLINPPGTLNEEAFDIIEKALKNKGNTKIEVDGEEDLVAIAAIDSAPEGTIIIYGQPDEGIVFMRLDKKTKKKIKEIIKAMQNENRDT